MGTTENNNLAEAQIRLDHWKAVRKGLRPAPMNMPMDSVEDVIAFHQDEVDRLADEVDLLDFY